MCEEVADCWCEEALRKQCKTVADHFHGRREYIHFAPQICPYITIAEDGMTAFGRWYVLGGKGAAFLYENTYVKEDGVWKLNVMSVGGFPMDLAMMAAGSNTGTRDLMQGAPLPPTAQQEVHHPVPAVHRRPRRPAHTRSTNGTHVPWVTTTSPNA
jgi:hypothetical protein